MPHGDSDTLAVAPPAGKAKGRSGSVPHSAWGGLGPERSTTLFLLKSEMKSSSTSPNSFTAHFKGRHQQNKPPQLKYTL